MLNIDRYLSIVRYYIKRNPITSAGLVLGAASIPSIYMISRHNVRDVGDIVLTALSSLTIATSISVLGYIIDKHPTEVDVIEDYRRRLR